ncbi:hypothetical protein D3C81_1554120 [compost metagenome]
MAKIRHRPIITALSSKPGMIPAMNSEPIDTVPPAASEYSTELWLGGVSSACTEPLTVTAVENSRG